MTTTGLDLIKAWVVTLGVSILQTAILAFNVGRLRGVHKSWATEEDKEKNGGIVGDVPEVQRANAAHRNQLENLPLFIGASTLFVFVAMSVTGAERDFQAGIVLFTVFSAARLLHTVAYLNALQPWRTIGFLTGTLTIFTTVLYAIINVFANSP